MHWGRSGVDSRSLGTEARCGDARRVAPETQTESGCRSLQAGNARGFQKQSVGAAYLADAEVVHIGEVNQSCSELPHHFENF